MEATTASESIIYINNEDQTGCGSNLFPDICYLDDWPMPGDSPPPWLPPNARTFKCPRWLPPRCHLPSLVPRRDFPRLARAGKGEIDAPQAATR